MLCSVPRYIVDNAKVFKAAKQWQAAREYCIQMLPVARHMVDFDVPNDRKAKDATIDALTALKAEAESKLGITVAKKTPAAAAPSSAAASASAASSSSFAPAAPVVAPTVPLAVD